MENKAYNLRNKDNKAIESNTPGTIGGHKGLKIYGKLDCKNALRWIAKGYYVAHRVFFANEATAQHAGYRPCACCMRKEYDIWKASQTAKLQAA